MTDAFALDDLSFENAQAIADNILGRTPLRPLLGIICETGLDAVSEAISETTVIPYADLAGFPQSTVTTISGSFVIGRLSGKPVILMRGPCHAYEGYSPEACAFPVRVMKLLGVQTLFVTNASGGLKDQLRVGDIMIIRDHINLPAMTGFSPLRGHNDERFGQRFIAMSDAYDPQLIRLAQKVSADLGHSDYVQAGCYAMQMGPSYETAAEYRMIALMGADSIGMSAAHEVTVARHMGMRVFGLSLITNRAITTYDRVDTLSHEEVMSMCSRRAAVIRGIICDMISQL